MRVMLNAAGKTYSACAKKTAATARGSDRDQRLIGFGLTSDWVRRAAALKPLTYEGRLMNRSPRSTLVSEMVRFNFQWTAMNAIFARPAILGPKGRRLPKKELEQFRLVLDSVRIPTKDVALWTQTLQALLGAPMENGVATIAAIQSRYIVDAPGKKTVDMVAKAARSGILKPLDLPTLVYVARNWFVHGVVTNKAFNSVPKFGAFVDTINEALATAHLHAAEAFLALM